MSATSNYGMLLVVSGPSGAGKGTVLKRLLEENSNVVYSISATTRRPREGELNGVHYHFVSKDEFCGMIDNGEMLEYASYNQNYYGTPLRAVEDARREGKDVLLEIEVQGAFSVKKKCPDAAFVFILPPSMTELERRLRGRNTESEEEICGRLETARKEIALAHNYDYLIVNDDIETAWKQLNCVICAEKQKTQSMKAIIDQILAD